MGDVVHAQPIVAVAVDDRNSSPKSNHGGNNKQWNENYQHQQSIQSNNNDDLNNQMQDLAHHMGSLGIEGMEQNVYEMGGDVNGSTGDGNWADDTIERSGNLFGQLDSMIAAVQNESSALDSMREKLKELDGMRVQLSSLTKRLLEADQANLTLKSNLVKIQEAYADLRRKKQEMESGMVPLRQELNRSKEMYSKERMARLSAQQETSMLKDQLLRLEKINEDLERDVKTIPALADSNELLKTDLTRIRNRYKEEKNSLTSSNNLLQEQNRDLEASKAEIRGLAVRLLDLASQNTQGAAKRQVGASQNDTKRQAPHHQAMQWEQQYQQQQQQQQQQPQQQYNQQYHQQYQQQQMQNSQSVPHMQHHLQQQQQQQQQQVNHSNISYASDSPTGNGGGGNAVASPGSVNNGRGLDVNDQPWLPATLEEHMLGTGHHNMQPAVPQGYYGAGDDASLQSHQTENTHRSHVSINSHGGHSIQSHNSMSPTRQH